MLPAIRDIISARRIAVFGLWHSSAAPATGEPLSSCEMALRRNRWHRPSYRSGVIAPVQAALLLVDLPGTQPADIAACNSSSSVSRFVRHDQRLDGRAQIAVAHRDGLIEACS